MSKKFRYFLLLAFASVAVSAQVGIGTTSPQCTLDIKGNPTSPTVLDGMIPPRLTGDQLGAKTYTTSQTGAVVYVTNPKATSTNPQVASVNSQGIYYFDGTKWSFPESKTNLYFGTLGAGTTTSMLTLSYTGSYIDLPPGEYLVNVQMICTRNNQIPAGEGYFFRTTFTESSVSSVSSPDIIGSDLISKDIQGPGFYYLLSGFIRIKNSTSTTKRYYYWKLDCGSYGTGTSSSQFVSFGANSTTWREDVIYAFKTN